MAELLTRWVVTDPARVGPAVLPALTSDVVLFTHVLNPEGAILLQRDALPPEDGGQNIQSFNTTDWFNQDSALFTNSALYQPIG